MTESIINIQGRDCHVIYACDNPEAVIIKPLGEFERSLLLDECRMISERSAVPFVLVAFEVVDKDLLPDGVNATFSYLRDALLPYIKQTIHCRYTVIGGYSLGGLFALWCATKLDDIDAVFAGSPSLWMDGWDKYAESHPVKARYVYMSLGDKEECTRKQPYCRVGDRVRLQHQLHLQQLGADRCTMEWNQGGHFNDTELRKAKGFAWCLNKNVSAHTAMLDSLGYRKLLSRAHDVPKKRL